MAKPSEKDWIEKTVTYKKCPKCPNGVLDSRIPRQAIVKYLFFWLDVKRYKCNTCEAKVYVRNPK